MDERSKAVTRRERVSQMTPFQEQGSGSLGFQLVRNPSGSWVTQDLSSSNVNLSSQEEEEEEDKEVPSMATAQQMPRTTTSEKQRKRRWAVGRCLRNLAAIPACLKISLRENRCNCRAVETRRKSENLSPYQSREREKRQERAWHG